MSHLIQRPDYIQYSQVGLEKGRYTVEDREKLEDEPAIFQWEVPYAFMFEEGPIKLHLKALSIMCVPYLLCFLYSIYNSINHNRSPWEDNGIFVFFGVFIVFAYSLFWYISRTQYYHVVYKITESGILRDVLKRYPKFRYRKQDPAKLMYFLRFVSIPLIIMALVIDPLLLAGAAGAVFLSFVRFPADEGERADYIPSFWNKPNLPEEKKLSYINISNKRKIIDVLSKDGSKGVIIQCTSNNFEEVKTFIINKLPNAELDDVPAYT
ncbi:hypothetical protein [Psychromonas sp. SP041]|uniref:hypothetical protein n=1 Tax=Psychromonas sp. SP041 TaxID=1365007 RepID=UPI000406B980|nr:hypothetical protein [Psychromonas sp. SP041]